MRSKLHMWVSSRSNSLKGELMDQYGMINRLDDQLGEIMDVLRSDQYGTLWNSTYTMIFTDHGEYLGGKLTSDSHR